jgi:hypothetical protein
MAIRLTESRLRQIIREEASKLTRRPVSRRTHRLRESDGSFQDYFDLIESVAEEEGFFEMELDEGEAQRIVEETLADDFGGSVPDDMIFRFVDALVDKHEELFDPSDDDSTNDGSSYPQF